MEDCIFCKIISGEIPSYEIYSDEHVYAFLDINPCSEGHTLVIPKQHYRWIWDIPDPLLEKLITISKKIALNMRSTSKEELVMSFIWGVDVNHAHLHLLPNVNKGLGPHFSKSLERSRKSISGEKLSEIQDRFKITSENS